MLCNPGLTEVSNNLGSLSCAAGLHFSCERHTAGDTALHPVWEHMAEEQQEDEAALILSFLRIRTLRPTLDALLHYSLSIFSVLLIVVKHGYKVNKLTSKILKLYSNGNQYDIQYRMITRAEQSHLSRSYFFYI